VTDAVVTGTPAATARPPLWLVLATAAMAIVLLVMSITETSFKGQFLIDQGESLSLVGLVFILIAGLYLHRRNQLAASLPLVVPWLLYPVITQGDQIIDNLSITWMRIVVHVLLAAIFAAPVAVIVFGVRWLAAPSRRTLFNIALALLIAELWIAYQFLGLLMIGTQLAIIAMVVVLSRKSGNARVYSSRRQADLAWWTLVVGVIASGALYLGFKNRPGAYQGSPSYYMDPSQPDAGYSLAKVPLAAAPATAPANADAVRSALITYADSLQLLLDGYYVLDRNYNYHFHNELFLQSTPLLPDYRRAGLAKIEDANRRRAEADVAAAAALTSLPIGDPLAALLQEVKGYAAFNFERAATLERMSAQFETTKAGLQHATHIYEGEGKYLGVQLAALLDKHRVVLNDPKLGAVVNEFAAKSRAIHDKYANRIVGF
jgi:hypothetical protein